MTEHLKEYLYETKLVLMTNLDDLIAYYSGSQEKKSVVLFMVVLSAILVCLGLNFDKPLVIYSGLLISPFIFSFLQFTIGVYKRKSDLVIAALIKIFVGGLVTFLIGLIYFYIAPFTYNIQTIGNWAEVDIATYLAVFLIAISIFLFNSHRISMIIWILKFLVKWPVLIIASSVMFIQRDGVAIYEIIIRYKLLFLLLFMGLSTLLYLSRVSREGIKNNRFKWIYFVTTLVCFLFGLYFSSTELTRATTRYNLENYIENELASQSFTVHNFVIDKWMKEVIIYYSGNKPSKSQDADLKKKYHLEGYHFDYREFR
ncbi:MAG: hypothetical protein JNL75_02825 [Chitinophagales bacterium]|nr:hypothetical protein [Chitinophagales bacterium]